MKDPSDAPILRPTYQRRVLPRDVDIKDNKLNGSAAHYAGREWKEAGIVLIVLASLVIGVLVLVASHWFRTA